ncbi:MAG: DUF47 domain-containing protein [Thermotogaceae bacterium]|nr:DUF47 domain-containing protein [Thermotogaceae bacterium]
MAFSFAKREKEVIDNLIELSHKTVEVTTILKHLFELFFADDDHFSEVFNQVKDLERNADEIRRSIISETYKGLFLPDMREVIHSLTEGIDRVVNKCESVSKILSFQTPYVPAQIREKMIGQLECAISASGSFTIAVQKLFDNIDEVHHYVLQVEEFEHNEDVIEGESLKEIFSLDLPLAEKLQLKELVINIGDIVDRTEDASDILEVLLLKLSY